MVSSIRQKIVEVVKQRNNRRCLVLIILATALVLVAFTQVRADRLESWQSCCGAVCLRTVTGLLGSKVRLAEIRELLRSNIKGQTSLAQIAETAEKMGFHAKGLRIKSEKLQECSVPLIAHEPPNHFVVLLGLGKKSGVSIINPPKSIRKMTVQELTEQEYWNVVAISKHPISIEQRVISKAINKVKSRFKQDTAKTYGGLRFDNTTWYFGEVGLNVEKRHTFSFENVGRQLVTLSKVKANCSCVKIINFTKEVAPGEHGTIEIVFNSGGMLGYVAKNIIGVINETKVEKNQQLLLKVTGEVSKRGELILEPARILLPDMVKGTIVSKKITLKRIGYDHLYLKKIETNSRAISVNVIQGDDPDACEAQIRVQVKSPNSLGPFEYKVVFETDFPDYPSKSLLIHGNVVYHIDAEPAQVLFGLLSAHGILEKNITLTSKTATPFEIKSVKSNVDSLITTACPVNKNQDIWEITLTNAESLRTGILKGEVLVEINDPDVPKIQIPFMGLVKR